MTIIERFWLLESEASRSEKVIQRQRRQKLKCSRNLHLISIRDRNLVEPQERFGLDKHLLVSILLTHSGSAPCTPAKPAHLVTQLITPLNPSLLQTHTAEIRYTRSGDLVHRSVLICRASEASELCRSLGIWRAHLFLAKDEKGTTKLKGWHNLLSMSLETSGIVLINRLKEELDFKNCITA